MIEKRKTSEFFTKGFQLNRCYQEDWDKINTILKRNGIKLINFGPVLTMNELKYIELGEEFVQKHRDDDRITRYINRGIVNVNSALLTAFLRTFPEYSYQVSYNQFVESITKNSAFLGKLFDLEGSIKETNIELQQIINDFFFAENKNLKKI